MPFDCPRVVFERYQGRTNAPVCSVWSERAPSRDWRAGTRLRLILRDTAELRWREQPAASWQPVTSSECLPGVHTALLPTERLPAGARIEVLLVRPDDTTDSGRYEIRASRA